jgi:tRNA(Ile)-lysidine synthetase-like protein
MMEKIGGPLPASYKVGRPDSKRPRPSADPPVRPYLGMDLPTHLTAVLRRLRLPAGRALVAVSGGPDSLALLDLLVRTHGEHGLELVVAHADHGIHPDSAKVAEGVQAAAAGYALPCIVGHLHLAADHAYPTETVARTSRHGWLRQVATREHAGVIFLAHHADDQAETVLLRSLKGSGVTGLRGMDLRRGLLVRPLLAVPRALLREYVADRRLQPWEDPANADHRHLRSWIRGSILPQLRERVPAVDRHLRRTARDAMRNADGWSGVLRGWSELEFRDDPAGPSISAAAVSRCEPALAESIVRTLGRMAGGVVGPKAARRALELAHGGVSGKYAQLGAGWVAELSFGRLVVRPESPTGPLTQLMISGDTGESGWGSWRVSWRREPAPAEQGRGGFTAWFLPDNLAVRPWRRGDRILPLGGTGRRLAVRCFQDARVPAGRRARWPLIDAGGRLIWIPGVCRSTELLPPEGAEALRVDVHVT